MSTLKGGQMYETTQLARNTKTGDTVLMGHLTVWKGHSRFWFAQGERPESMKMRAYCNYGVSMPPGKSIEGEKLLVAMGGDGLRALEHLGDLIALANNVRLKQRCPIDPDDRGLVACTHGRFIDWMSGAKPEDADRFVRKYGLDRFYYGVVEKDPEFGKCMKWALYYSGGQGLYYEGTNYPKECYLPITITWPFGNPREDNGGRVIDFSNPLAVQCERERVFKALSGMPTKVHWNHLDYADAGASGQGSETPS